MSKGVQVNYLCTSPPEKVENTDAMYQEIRLLKQTFPGAVTSLFPFRNPSSLVPPLLMGLHNLSLLRKLEQDHDINHIFAAGLFHLPVLYRLRKPIVYTIAGGVSSKISVPPKQFLRRLDRLVVSSKRDQKTLEKILDIPVDCILPSIQVDDFGHSPMQLSAQETLHVLMASAPWELRQFESKGVHLILEVLQATPNLEVTFLWRGLHADHMRKLIGDYEVGDRAHLMNKKVDVNELMQRMHATILLCNDPTLIKSYPHSLIESLLCGRPIITTPEIAMSDMVASEICGLVLPEFSKEALQKLLTDFRENYSDLQKNAVAMPKAVFAPEEKIERYGEVYRTILNGG